MRDPALAGRERGPVDVAAGHCGAGGQLPNGAGSDDDGVCLVDRVRAAVDRGRGEERERRGERIVDR